MNVEVPQHPEAAEKLMECITEPGWVEADEPDKALLGFVNYDRSTVRFFCAEFVMTMPDGVVSRLRAWRAKRGVIVV